MIEYKTVLAIITARGGSQGIPHKNIRDTGGKPLIAWTIDAAKKSRYLDRFILSSDSLKIIEIAKSLQCEVPFIRPDDLAQDDTNSVDVLLHAIDSLPENYDYIVLLQPTSPLRKAEDIDACISLCHRHGASSCVSVSESSKSPYWTFELNEQNRLSPVIYGRNLIHRRQDLPKTYTLNGAVYVAKTEWFRTNRAFISCNTMGFVMDRLRSLDIDTELDIEWFEFILARNRGLE